MSAAAEAPAGEETVDTHTAGMDGQSETFVRRVYTAEQQARLKVDKHGKTTVEEPGGEKASNPGEERLGAMRVYTSEQQARLKVDECGKATAAAEDAGAGAASGIRIVKEAPLLIVTTRLVGPGGEQPDAPLVRVQLGCQCDACLRNGSELEGCSCGGVGACSGYCSVCQSD